MSLKKRIILLFVVLAVVPLLALAAFSYWQAQGLLERMVHTQLEETAGSVQKQLESSRGRIAAGLEVMANHSGPFLALPTFPDSLFEKAVFIRFKDESGVVRLLHGALPKEHFNCCNEQNSMILEFSKDSYRTNGGVVTVGFWAADLMSLEGRSASHEVSVFDPTTNSVIYSDTCADGLAETAPFSDVGFFGLIGRPEPTGTFGVEREGEARLGAYSKLSASGWVVSATSGPVGVAASLNRMVLVYWLFVLGLGLFTSLAFSVLLGRFTKSLNELARAAEEIGTGELDPWLPLPTSGEIGTLTLAFSRMLARIRQMMTQVDQSGRLAVVGQLSAYLAHEIRNPLSSIKLNLQRLRRWTKNGSIPEFCLEPLEISLKEVERLSSSVAGVLQLSRAQDSPREVVGLHDLAGEASDLLAARFRRQGVELTLDLDAGADRVLARPGQLKSALLNLMMNALEAQPKGGRLEIRSELSRAPGLEGPFVALRLKDQGGGVPPEIRDRIFEPFFTTKTGGSGIGLAMAIQAIRDNSGELYLETALSAESGAEFVLVFPLASVAPAETQIPSGLAPNYRDLALGWGPKPSPAGDGSSEKRDVPSHLMTPEGLKAVLALSLSESDDVN